ncbi:MAG: WXG100 family type VII secretion target [Porcipelethomonas sp.]
MTGTLKVSSEQLVSTAQEFSSDANVIRTLTSDMMNKITGLSSVWEGDASMTYINKFKSLETDINKLLSMIQEHVRDLQDMAQGYTEAESANESAASALQSGIIS